MADYAISNVPRRVVYANSGVGPYAFTFEILSQTDIAVYRGSTLLTLTTDYSVTINTNGTGSVTLVTAGTGNITIVGAKNIQRTTDFTTGGDLFANALNDELDNQTIFIQQVAETAERGLKAPVTDPTDINMTLPTRTSRAGKTLAFDSNGNPVVGEDIGNWQGNWAAGTAYTVRDLVKDASNYNVYRCNTAHTSSGVAPIKTNADSAKWDLVVDAEYAAEQAQDAADSATAAASSASAASSSASSASSSASAASTSATNAANSASSASTSATNASNSATSASSSASSASTSASNASTSATNAANSATSASNSATSAASSASTATTQATNASNSASAASTSASQAATSATNASNSASSASTSATNAANSATAAASSATAADASAVSAAASAASAAASYDSFDDRYLGAKSSAPATDNDGNALVTGALYYNTTTGKMNVWDGGTWIEASAASQAILTIYQFTATGGQTTFSGTDNNALTLGYTVGSAIVTLNGVVLEIPSEVTASNGTSVVLASGATAGDELNVYAFSTFNLADVYTKAQTNAGFVALTGDQSIAGNKNFAGNTLFVDDTNDRVGIGTNSPASQLDISRSGDAVVSLTSAGVQRYQLVTRSGGNFEIVDQSSSATRVSLTQSGNFGFNSGYGSVATAYGCRAWVNFNGTGTVAIRGSGNVSSITDNNVGDFTVNFSTSMPDRNYATQVTVNDMSWGGYGNPTVFDATLTGSVRIYTFFGSSNTNNLGDPTICSVSIFR